jgi:hypothetical protein
MFEHDRQGVLMTNVSQPPDSVPGATIDGGAPPRRRSFWSRLWKSKLLRLAVALLTVLVVLGLLAFAVTRVIGTRGRFSDFSLPYVEDFSEVDVKAWFTSEGVWSLRQGMLAQAANLNKPAYLYVPRKMPAEQPYHLSTYITLAKPTQEAGISFNAQYPKMTTQQHKVYIARNRPQEGVEGDGAAAPAGPELVAGYTDERGEFIRQVSVPLASDLDEYRLDLYVLGNTYTVQLNGQTLIERRPLFHPNGLIGFYTLGPVKFDLLKITTAETEEPGEQVYVSDFEQTPGGAGWVPFSGEWEVADGELVQANPAAQNAAIGYEGSSFENYMAQTMFRHLVGTGGGLLFNMVSPYQLNGSQVARYSDQTDSVFWGYFDAQGHFTRQGFAEVEPPGTSMHRLTVYVGSKSYDVYLDDKLLGRDVPLQASVQSTGTGQTGGHIGLISSLSSVAYATVEVYPLFGDSPVVLARAQQGTSPASTPPPPPSPASDSAHDAGATKTATAVPSPETRVPVADGATPTKVPGETGGAATPGATQAADAATAVPGATRVVPTALPAASPVIVEGGIAPWQSEFRGDLREAGWRPLTGRWRFGNGDLLQDDIEGFDQAIVYTKNAFRNYTYEAGFSHRDGNGAGILFNMPYSDRLNGATMVRYSDRRPGGIFWGYFDATGKFVGQGYANVDPPGDVRHSIRVVSEASTYSVYLDDILLAANLPLQNKFGYVGLITSRSSANYDSLQVTGSGASALARQTPVASAPLSAAGLYSGTEGFPEGRPISGKWEVDGGRYRQSAPDPADYVFSTGLYAGNFTVRADVLLPDKPDSGAGFMVQMPERGRKAGATVVRLINSGDGIFWGVYDAAGGFRGRGSADLPAKDEGETGFQLQLDVKGETMDIFVDDQLIAKDVVLPRSDGWIGLMSYGGPVTLANVEIMVRQPE